MDTHITRVSARLGMIMQTDPVKIERELTELVPRERWIEFGNQIIHHGHYVCRTKDPQCDTCRLAPMCPSSGLGAARPTRPTRQRKVGGSAKARA